MNDIFNNHRIMRIKSEDGRENFNVDKVIGIGGGREARITRITRDVKESHENIGRRVYIVWAIETDRGSGGEISKEGAIEQPVRIFDNMSVILVLDLEQPA